PAKLEMFANHFSRESKHRECSVCKNRHPQAIIYEIPFSATTRQHPFDYSGDHKHYRNCFGQLSHSDRKPEHQYLAIAIVEPGDSSSRSGNRGSISAALL